MAAGRAREPRRARGADASPWDQVDAGPSLEELLASLPTLAAQAAAAEEQLRERVAILKDRRATWAEIGAALSVTRQAAWERFGPRARRSVSRLA